MATGEPLRPRAVLSIGTDVRASADARSLVDDGAGVNAGSVSWWLIKKFDRAGESEVRVASAQSWLGKFWEILCHDDGGSACCPRRSRVFGIGNKSKFAGPGLFDALQTFDFHFPIAGKPDFKPRSNLGKFHVQKDDCNGGELFSEHRYLSFRCRRSSAPSGLRPADDGKNEE